jgi:hypothetical protein
MNRVKILNSAWYAVIDLARRLIIALDRKSSYIIVGLGMLVQHAWSSGYDCRLPTYRLAAERSSILRACIEIGQVDLEPSFC